jgi:hypothetical protein
MNNAIPPSVGKWNNPKEGNINSSEDNFWQNLTEGELIDIDVFTACAIGEFDYVKTLIFHNAKSGEDIVNKSNSAGWTPLMYVCYVGNDKITELLIREGADVSFEENRRGCAPLMFAASSGNISLVKRLVEVSLTKQLLNTFTYLNYSLSVKFSVAVTVYYVCSKI